jgi:hypothetical protein
VPYPSLPPRCAPPAWRPGRAFCALLQDSDAAFEELYCAAFALLDELWLAQGASYMEFNQVMGAVKQRVDAALRARPKSVAALTAALAPRSGGAV